MTVQYPASVKVATEILGERIRQIKAEWRSVEHDDNYEQG
jgi:hypothetical protein